MKRILHWTVGAMLMKMAFCIGMLGVMLRNLAIFKEEESFTW